MDTINLRLLAPAALGDMEDEAVRAWRDLFKVTTRTVREAVAGVVKDGAEILTEEFYDRMLQHPRASAFLDQDRVQKRLRASLRSWMAELFAALDDDDIAPAIVRQVEVGVVHARIRLPIDLISAGIRVLKRGIRRRIDFAPLSEADRLIALIYVSDLLHLADSLMNHAYLRDAQDVVRNDEAFRLVTQKRSATVERARQRAALSEWAEGLLMAAWGQARGPLVRLRDSEFGIWIHHKGVVLFDGAPDLRDIAEAIERMDTLLLPRLQSALQQQQPLEQAIGAVKNQLDLIRLKLNDLFEHCLGQDDGLDQETQLPDRRYLPAILVREMQAHSASARVFCVGMLGLQFPELRDSGARSRLMQVAANTLAANIRTTDHLFRYDEQRFLLIAVECDRQKASELLAGLSEELRHALQAGPVNGSWTPVHTGLSVGVAEYDRHPDYQYLIQRAETAQTDSERAGRSRVAFG